MIKRRRFGVGAHISSNLPHNNVLKSTFQVVGGMRAIWFDSTLAPTKQWKDGPFRSNAEPLIAKVGVIEVEGMTAVCNGGGGALGHPIEYIQLNTVTAGEVRYCCLLLAAS